MNAVVCLAHSVLFCNLVLCEEMPCDRRQGYREAHTTGDNSWLLCIIILDY